MLLGLINLYLVVGGIAALAAVIWFCCGRPGKEAMDDLSVPLHKITRYENRAIVDEEKGIYKQSYSKGERKWRVRAVTKFNDIIDSRFQWRGLTKEKLIKEFKRWGCEVVKIEPIGPDDSASSQQTRKAAAAATHEDDDAFDVTDEFLGRDRKGMY